MASRIRGCRDWRGRVALIDDLSCPAKRSRRHQGSTDATGRSGPLLLVGDVDARRTGHQPDEQDTGALPVRDPWPVPAQRDGPIRRWKQRFYLCPGGIEHLGSSARDVGDLHFLVVPGVRTRHQNRATGTPGGLIRLRKAGRRYAGIPGVRPPASQPSRDRLAFRALWMKPHRSSLRGGSPRHLIEASCRISVAGRPFLRANAASVGSISTLRLVR